MKRPPVAPSLRIYRLLLRLLPEPDRERDRAGLEEAFKECFARERQRRGPVGLFYAWSGIVVDTLHAGWCSASTRGGVVVSRPSTIRARFQETHS